MRMHSNRVLTQEHACVHMLQLRACTEYPSAVGAKSAKCKPCSCTHACAHVCVHVCAATCMLPKPSRAMQPLNPSPLLLLTPPLPFALSPNKALHCSCAPQHQGHPPPPTSWGAPSPHPWAHTELAELCPRYFLFIFGAVRIMEQGCLLARV